MNPIKPWLIKVLNGPNAGAQILVSTEVTVGTSVDCDLILNDPHICPVHCQIKKGEAEEFEVIPQNGVIFINGKKVSESTAKLTLGEVLTLGSTHLTGGPSEQLWPPVTIPIISEVRGEAEPISPEASSVTLLTPAKSKPKFPLRFLIIIITIAALMLIGFALLRFLVHKNLMISKVELNPSTFQKSDVLSSKEGNTAEDVAMKTLQRLLPKITIKKVEVNGQNVLYIYVHDQVGYDAVRKVINLNNINVVCNIIDIDNIDDSGLAMMQALNLSVSVAVDQYGKATWTGYIPDKKLLDSMKEQIARDISAITDNEYHIILGEEATATAINILVKNQFGTVTVTPERNNLTLTGAVFAGDQPRWRTTLQELETTFGNKVKLNNLVTINPMPVRQRCFFNAPVVSLSVSSFPYAVLQNGEHIFVGAKVKDGYTVDSITTAGIGLINDGNKKIIPVAGQ